MDSQRLASALVDDILTSAMVPWACPCPFGTDERYTLEDLISIGRRSLVYRGTDRVLSGKGFSATVVIKIITRAGAGAVDAKSARRIEHPNVVRVLDFGVDGPSGAEYIVTEHVAGGDMSKLQVPVSETRAAALVASLATGVQAAHSAGVVHCDLKPHNVLLTPEGEPKLADFDLCASPETSDQTARGNEAFMAPEQLEGKANALTPLADIYALGGILRWLLTGFLPQQPSDRLIDSDLQAIIRRALDPVRERRFETAGALAEDLRRCLEHRPLEWTKPLLRRRARLWLRRNPVRAAIAAAAAILGVSLAGLWLHLAETERLQRERADAAIVCGLEEEIAKLKKQGGASLKGILQMMGNGGAKTIDRAFQQVSMLEVLQDSEFFDEAGKAQISTQRIIMLEHIVSYAIDEDGKAENSETALARYVLVHHLIDAGQWERAQVHLAPLEAWFNPRFPESDPLTRGLRIMQACVAAEADRTPATFAALAQAVQIAIDESACEAMNRLGTRVLERLRKDSPASLGGTPAAARHCVIGRSGGTNSCALSCP